mgnify:CR=1 FL=1
MTLTPNRREEMLRVDHAGEYGAVAIYRGQLAVFERQQGRERITEQLKEMAGQEQEHLDAFDKLLNAGSVRPTALSPVWNAAGFALGAATALLGEKAAHLGLDWDDATGVFAKVREEQLELEAAVGVRRAAGEEVVGAARVAVPELDLHVAQVAVHIALGHQLEGLAARLTDHLEGQQRVFQVTDGALATGMALAGMRPVVALYSTFSQRAFDQLLIRDL